MIAVSKKICLLGDFGVGKTSLVRRFVYDLFDDRYLSTVGVKVSRKTVMVPHQDDMVEMTMMLWDLAGSEEFDRVRASYLRGTAGAILVCDLTRPTTLDSLRSYLRDLSSISPHTRIVLAGNKRDLLDQRQLAAAQIEAFATEHNFQWYLTSARNGDEVETVFRHLGRALLA